MPTGTKLASPSPTGRTSRRAPVFVRTQCGYVSGFIFALRRGLGSWPQCGVGSASKSPCGRRGALRASAGHVEELELDVVGIPEDDHRVGHRLFGVDQAGVLDAEFVQPACPSVQGGPISDAE